MRTHIGRTVTAFLTGLVVGCSPIIHKSPTTTPARIGAETRFHSELKRLPAPKEKLIAAVYKFRDQTGQYKPTEFGSSWSTAVTQGATTILIRTLEESQWFRPLERENLGNLSSERQIITNTLARYEGKKATALSPLLFAGIILEGGIISYETNVRTGGIGIRYFGTGASGQYREDRVTIYLRAVSTRNGEILTTVHASKSILSQQIDIGIFRYVKFKRLLEAETGITYNEPSTMAVTEAIEKAVYSLIIEGIIDGLWDTQASPEEKQKVIAEYHSEKEENEKIDHQGKKRNENITMISLGAFGGTSYLDSDLPDSDPGFNTGVSFQLRLSPLIALNTEAEYGILAPKSTKNSQYFSFTPSLRIFFLTNERFSPYAGLGYGFFTNAVKEDNPKIRNNFGFLSTSLGFNYVIHPRIHMDIGLNNKYFNNDELDQITKGSYRDMTWEAHIGINYILGKNWNKKSLLQRK